MKYQYFGEFDNKDLTGTETMKERFYFSGYSARYSYNQAVFLMGNCLQKLSSNTFKVVATNESEGKCYTLYEGDNAFYDWYLELGADDLRPFNLINFHDKENGEVYQLDRVYLDGEYFYIVYTG